MTTNGRSPRILYLQYTNPAAYPPLQHSAEILAEAGWRVRLIGVARREVSGLAFSDNDDIEIALLPEAPRGWRQRAHYLRFAMLALATMLRWRPLWIYASDALSAPVGLIATWVPGVSVVYHEHDEPSASSAFMRLVVGARNRLLRRARLVVAPNADRVARLQAIAPDGAPVACVWNCPRQREAASRSMTSEPDADRNLCLVYHGSIVPARVPTALIEALARLPPTFRLRISGYETSGHPGYVHDLRRLAEEKGVGDRLEIRLVVPTRDELLDVVRRSHVGLALMPIHSGDTNECHMTGASNKAFEYLAQGVPLLVSDLPDWRQVFADRGLARTCRPDDPESVANALRWFAANRAEARRMGESGRRLVREDWNYEQVFQPVLEVLTRP